MNKILLVIGVTILLAGCAATKQAITDYKAGANTPLVNGEIAPAAQGAVIQNTVSALPVPFAAPIALGLGFLATAFFTWQRGVNIRKSGGAPVSAAPSVHTNGVLQDIANIFSGMFTVASTTAPSAAGSVFQRVWKVAVATVASGVGIAAADPSFLNYLTGHPYLDAIFVSASAGIAGLEKALSTVPVPASISPTVATS